MFFDVYKTIKGLSVEVTVIEREMTSFEDG